MAKKTIHFTQARIAKLKPPEKGRDEYYDDEARRLMCRVSSSGVKTFAVVKWANGKTHRVTIGNSSDVSVLDARKKEKEILSLINEGINPTDAKRKNEASKTTLGNVLDLYLADRDLKEYTIKDYRYKLKQGFNDWLSSPVSNITEDMVLKRQKKISKSGKTSANTTMRVLRLTLNYAKALGMIDSTPTDILSKARLWHKNNRRSQVIPSDKLQAWHASVVNLPNVRAKTYLLMALYMGFRSTEILTMKWVDIDLKKKTITLIDTKNRSDHKLPIPNPLLPYIKELKSVTGNDEWVFSGATPKGHMSAPSHGIKVVRAASGVNFSPHDCRRTFATIAEAVNLPLTMIKRLMNHVTTNDVTGGYIVTEEETLKKAINKVAAYIQSKVTIDSNIIQFNAK